MLYSLLSCRQKVFLTYGYNHYFIFPSCTTQSWTNKQRRRRKMKKTVWILTMLLGIVFTFCVGPVSGEESSRLNLTYGADFATKYVSSTSGNPVLDKPVFQHSLLLKDSETGMWGKIFHSASLSGLDFNDNSGDEIDFTVGQNSSLGPFDTGISFAYYDLHDLSMVSDGRFNLKGAVSYSGFENVVLSADLGWLMHHDFEEGSFSHNVGVNYKLPSEVDSSVKVLFGGNSNGSDNAIRFTWNISPGFYGMHFNANFQHGINDSGKDVVWFGVGRSFVLF